MLNWKTEQRKVKDLMPYEFNPRTMDKDQVARLEKSLKKFNLAEIPAINTDNTIIAGHQRLAVLARLGRSEDLIDVRVPSRKLTEEEFKEYNLTSNKVTGNWDFDLLANNFEEEMLEDLGFELGDMGDVDNEEIEEKEEKEKGTIICPNCGEVINQ